MSFTGECTEPTLINDRVTLPFWISSHTISLLITDYGRVAIIVISLLWCRTANNIFKWIRNTVEMVTKHTDVEIPLLVCHKQITHNSYKPSALAVSSTPPLMQCCCFSLSRPQIILKGRAATFLLDARQMPTSSAAVVQYV